MCIIFYILPERVDHLIKNMHVEYQCIVKFATQGCVRIPINALSVALYQLAPNSEFMIPCINLFIVSSEKTSKGRLKSLDELCVQEHGWPTIIGAGEIYVSGTHM